ncbi:MAG: N-acetylmuramoyl-L-alanine amidase, partial [Steroidobacterales bacterium]
ELASVLLDLSQTASIGASVEAADSVLGALDRVGAVRKREVQQAGFMVLKSPDIPSMLVETAYISNPSEEAKLRMGSQQQRLAAAIFTGVAAYFHKYPPEGSVFARQRGAGVDATASTVGAADEASAGADPLAVTGISGMSGMSGITGAPGALNIARNQP